MFFSAVLLVVYIFLGLSSIVDLKDGEVPETLSLGPALITVAAALATSFISQQLQPIASTILWAAIGFGVGYLLFALGQWGGADVKVLAGVGAFLGYAESVGYYFPNPTFLDFHIPPFATYFIDMAFAATPYVILYTLFLGVMKPSTFQVFLGRLNEPRYLVFFALGTAPFLASFALGFSTLSYVYLLLPAMILLSIYLKSVEEHVLTKSVPVSELADWDILAHNVVVDSKLIATRNNIEGVTPEQVEEIKKLAKQGAIPKDIEIRWGVKFVPILFIGLHLTLYVGNVLDILFDLFFQIH